MNFTRERQSNLTLRQCETLLSKPKLVFLDRVINTAQQLPAGTVLILSFIMGFMRTFFEKHVSKTCLRINVYGSIKVSAVPTREC